MQIKENDVFLTNHTNDEQTSEEQKEKLSFSKNIFIENYGILNYYFADDIDLIQDEIFKLTGNQIISNIDESEWESNPNLSENVKTVMDKLNVNFSLTYLKKEHSETLVINKRNGENWQIVCIEQKLRKDKKNTPATKFTKSSLQRITKLAKQGDVDAQLSLGDYFYNGELVSKNMSQAFYWYTKAAEQGNASAQYNLGFCYQNREGVEKDLEKAVFWCTQSAKQENSVAQYYLGECYYYGTGVTKNLEKAVRWYSKSAKQGNHDGQYSLGYCYRRGFGVVKNFEKAVYWFAKSADQGNAAAQYSLGARYHYGEGIIKNLEKAVYWYTKSAKQGDAHAQCYLGLCYYNGEGVVKNFEKAVYWYTKSAEQGDAIAQYYLGYCYYNGKGVGKEKAIYWFTKSAEQGDDDAQFKLGDCYYNGEGVVEDRKKASFWYYKSAEQGNVDALKKYLVCSNNTKETNKFKDISSKDLKCHKSIAVKNLFYPEKTQTVINELSSLLHHDHFSDIQKRLSENNMRAGFACLFSGNPGTGKTETALQIARICKRDIMSVDISEIKSKWFGESQKLIKGVFDKYRTLVEKCEQTPILLFNEADGVFSKRQSNDIGGTTQTENAIQNIILDEMENLNGILIATTNLANNFDPAFERRFLYKIEFENPNEETRKAIWRSSIEWLSENDASLLASRYKFSGGQIENVSRKSIVSQVLFGKNPTVEDIIKTCSEESLTKENTVKIGFNS